MAFGSGISEQSLTTTGSSASGNVAVGPRSDAVSGTISSSPNVSLQEPHSSDTFPSLIGTLWGDILLSGISQDLFNRLTRLASAPDGWKGRGSLALRYNAIRNFLGFWRLASRDAAEPELTLSADGSLYATWMRSPTQRLDAKFSESRISFGIVIGRSTFEGEGTRDQVAQNLKANPLKPLQWRRP